MTRAEVRVTGEVVASIDGGLVILVGVGQDDTESEAEALADKVVNLRIFRDAEGRTNVSLLDAGGEILAVSQFTLFADTRKGRRPSFISAASPDLGERLYEQFAAALEARGVKVGRGVFGAEMEVELINDGPMTIWLDTQATGGPDR